MDIGQVTEMHFWDALSFTLLRKLLVKKNDIITKVINDELIQNFC